MEIKCNTERPVLGRLASARPEAFAAGALLAGMAALSFAQVVARAAARSFSYTEEITRLLLAWACMMGAAEAARQGAHLGVRLVSILRPRLRYALRIVELSGLALFFLALGFCGAILVARIQIHQTTEALAWPKWPFGLAVPAGCAIAFARCVQRILAGRDAPPGAESPKG